VRNNIAFFYYNDIVVVLLKYLFKTTFDTSYITDIGVNCLEARSFLLTCSRN